MVACESTRSSFRVIPQVRLRCLHLLSACLIVILVMELTTVTLAAQSSGQTSMPSRGHGVSGWAEVAAPVGVWLVPTPGGSRGSAGALIAYDGDQVWFTGQSTVVNGLKYLEVIADGGNRGWGLAWWIALRPPVGLVPWLPADPWATAPESFVVAHLDNLMPDIWAVPLFHTRSVEGRPITGVEVGDGPQWIAVIGGLHQGLESNTTGLVQRLTTHFLHHSKEIPAEIGLVFISNANPDGAASGTRTNAHGVDLNRNWDAGWRPDTYGPFGWVRGGGGRRPFSEPETRALARYLVGKPFAAVIFFHSAGGAVIPGMGPADSPGLARDLARAASYIYLTEWTAYPLTGQAVDYLAGQGIPSVDVELSNHEDLDLARNLRGLRAAIAWVTANVPSG